MKARILIVTAGMLFLLGGCDVETDVVFQPEIKIGTRRDEARLKALEAEVVEQRERAGRLQAEVEDMQEQNIVLRTDDGFTFRLNTNAAVVLVIAILGIVTVLVARMKYARDAPDSD